MFIVSDLRKRLCQPGALDIAAFTVERLVEKSE